MCIRRRKTLYLEDRPITGIVGDSGVSEVMVENSGERLEYYIKKKKKSPVKGFQVRK